MLNYIISYIMSNHDYNYLNVFNFIVAKESSKYSATFWSVLSISFEAIFCSPSHKTSNRNSLDASLVLSYCFLASDLLRRPISEGFFLSEVDAPDQLAITPTAAARVVITLSDWELVMIVT